MIHSTNGRKAPSASPSQHNESRCVPELSLSPAAGAMRCKLLEVGALAVAGRGIAEGDGQRLGQPQGPLLLEGREGLCLCRQHAAPPMALRRVCIKRPTSSTHAQELCSKFSLVTGRLHDMHVTRGCVSHAL